MPYIPVNTGKFGEYGWSGILRGAGVVFFVFLGFDIVSKAAQETKNPKRNTPYKWLGQGVLLAILVGYTSVILVDLLGQSRVFYATSKDGLLPKVFSTIHPKYHTPWKSNILFCLFISLFTAFVPIKVVGEMTSIGTLLAFVIVCTGVWIMRYTLPDVPRPFKTPWVPFVPLMGILICVGMMIFLPLDTWLRLFVWMAMGMLIYSFYGRKHSKVRRIMKQP